MHEDNVCYLLNIYISEKYEAESFNRNNLINLVINKNFKYQVSYINHIPKIFPSINSASLQ